MNFTAVATVASGFLLYGLCSRRLEGSFLTGPLLFAAFGLTVGPVGFGIVALDVSHEALHLLAEITLILVLFADAASIDLARFRRDHNLPLRMLVMGMPLTILITAIVAAVLFADLSPWSAALLAAILAPTDAALGQAVVTSVRVPARIRQALNVESGLNDGIALPVVLVFASLASAMESVDAGFWFVFGLKQITLGPLAGIVVGYAGGKAVAYAHRRQWMSGGAEGVIVLAIAFLSFALAELVHGNGFIAAFVGGLVFGNVLKRRCEFLFGFADAEGQLLILMTFLVFGGAMLPEALGQINMAYLVFAILSLTVLRMLPVWVSLVGTGLRLQTRVFLGWFGPRGLASVLFVLLILEKAQIANRDPVFVAATTTVLLSIVLHGVTAGPVSKWYGRWVAQMGACEETAPISEEPFAAAGRSKAEPDPGSTL